MQPPIVCSRRRRQDLAAIGGSLDSLSSQPHQVPVFRRGTSNSQLSHTIPDVNANVSVGTSQRADLQHSSSTASSVSSASLRIKKMPIQRQHSQPEQAQVVRDHYQQPPVKPPRRRVRPSRQSLELVTFNEAPVVPLRPSVSSNAILRTMESSKTPLTDPILMSVSCHIFR